MSRRFSNRHAKVKARPNARAAKPMPRDPKAPRVLNARAFVKAGSALERERAKAREASETRGPPGSEAEDWM